ncbi:MAG: aromatic ring-hydroxylating dioxygenase subunit alpha [Sandaracinaceae bacterium]|nr:aromatic ring-hydroxylating dioxygenase subunit alpha [Sandaracinaceae bacterium]
MFDAFASQWTPVLFSRELPRAKPVGVRLAGERVVLWRDREGRARALIDRCPHRGVALSLGRRTREGRLECPFHGWQFDGGGGCAHVPFNAVSDGQRERMSATSLATYEAGGLVLVFTEPGASPGEPLLPEAVLRKDVSVYRYAETWKAHWTRAMENMLDAPHLPFVHRRSIGRGLRAPAEAGEVMRIEVEPREHGFRTTWATDRERESKAHLDWYRPNGMVLHLMDEPRLLRQHLWCVPVDATTTRMMLVSTRGFQRGNPLAWLFDRLNRFILAEDRRVVESSEPPEVPDPSAEASVASDRATLAFRRWYLRTLRPDGERARLKVVREAG